jgi:hypothetical protein
MSIFLKENKCGKWCATTKDSVLAYLKPENQPLSGDEKGRLPTFGFDKQAGASANKQQYPTNWVILELDAPAVVKANPDQVDVWRSRVMVWYVTMRMNRDLSYYWLYVTPSMCGLRFVLKTDQSILTEAVYKAVVLDYLQNLGKITNGDINETHYDIRLNQAWYVPTFKEYFHAKNTISNIGNIVLLAQKTESDKVNFLERQTFYNYNHCTAMDYFEKAEQFTQKNFTYTEGSRNDYIHNLICNLNRFGISKADAEGYVISNYDLLHKEITQILNGVYQRNAHEHAKFINQFPTK